MNVESNTGNPYKRSDKSRAQDDSKPIFKDNASLGKLSSVA